MTSCHRASPHVIIFSENPGLGFYYQKNKPLRENHSIRNKKIYLKNKKSFHKVKLDPSNTGSSPRVFPQWSGSGPGSLREAAALQPAQVQLLPLRPGSVRPAGSTGGDRED